MPIAALVPLIVAALAWIVYCLVDLSRSGVERLPRWAWVLIIVFSVPLGGIAFFVWGRTQR